MDKSDVKQIDFLRVSHVFASKNCKIMQEKLQTYSQTTRTTTDVLGPIETVEPKSL